VATTTASVASIAYGDSASSVPSQAPTSDLELALDELGHAMGGYRVAEEYYEGTRAEVFASVRLRRAMAKTGAAFKFNFAKKAVQAVVERLEIASVDSTTPGAKALIDDLWKDNKLTRQSKQIMRRASEYGDAYVIVWPSADTDWDGDGIRNVDVFYNSPQSVRIFYDAENPQIKAFAIKQWVLAAQKKVRVDLYYPDRIEKYVSKQGVLHPKAADMVQFYDTDDSDDEQDIDAGPGWPRPNPFGEIPIFHFRNDDPYGTPEHEGFYGTQDSLRKLVLSHMAGVDYQAFPQRYALADGTADSSELAAGDEDLFQFALDTGATSRAGDPQSQLSADAGSVWWLQGVKGVGQFDPADPATFTDPMTLYLRFGALITDTPLSRLDPTGAVESGESRRAANEPFTKKIEDRQESYGDTWCETVEFALKVLGIDDAEVTVRWKSAGVIDDESGWQTLLLKLQAGLPPKQAFMEAGYSQDQVDDWFGDGDDEQIDAELLLKLAQALGALAPAVSTGVIDDQQAQRMLAALMGDLLGSPAPQPDPAELPPAPVPPQLVLPAPSMPPAPEPAGDNPAD
jgi:Phage portal protein, SPP1 Gp6-like